MGIDDGDQFLTRPRYLPTMQIAEKVAVVRLRLAIGLPSSYPAWRMRDLNRSVRDPVTHLIGISDR
jgi:hypothetical protein